MLDFLRAFVVLLLLPSFVAIFGSIAWLLTHRWY
jgi:hypothetical protein